MKSTIAFAVLAICSIGFASCSNETSAPDMSQLPQSVQNVITDNFNSDVMVATTETNSFGADEYEVVLVDGTKVKFEGEEWEEVEVPLGQQVPATFIIEPIQSYISQNMPGQYVVKIDRDKKGYDVDLSNGVEVKFDTNGTFIKID